jgi:hypothetical protein
MTKRTTRPPGTLSARGAPARRSSMPPMDAPPELQCPIGLFEACEFRIRDLTAGINQSQGKERAAEARALLAEVGRLLQCESFNAGDTNCNLCRKFSELRRKTATLVVKIAGADPAHDGNKP